MFGYLKPKLQLLKKEHKEIYRAFYCGLCHALKRKSGCIGLSSLNYELTALLILAFSLKKEPRKIFHGTCSITPFLRVPFFDYFSPEFEIAADLSVYIVSCKIEDNIIDEGKARWKIASSLFKGKTEAASQRLNQFVESIDNALSYYYDLEHSSCSKFEDLMHANGYLLQCLLYPLLIGIDDETIRKSVLKVAELLGEWIYIIDACDDYQEDTLNQRFNPIDKLENKGIAPDIIDELAFLIQSEIQNFRIFNYDFLVHHLFVETVCDTGNRIIQKYNGKGH